MIAKAGRALRSPFIKEFMGFGSSTVAERASRLISGLVAAGMLGPLVWGHWYLLNLVLRYGSMIHLGAVNGMNREVPAARGRGDPEEAETLRRSSLGFLLASYVVAAGLLWLFMTVTGRSLNIPGLFPTLLLLGAQQLFSFAITSLKAQTAFGKISRLQLASALVYPPIVLFSTWQWGLNGFILGQAGAYTTLWLLAATAERGMYRWRFDWVRSLHLIGVGLPIMLVGVMDALFATVDRWVIAAFLDGEALGHYSLAVMTMGAIGMLPQVISQQTYPRIAYAWSARRDTEEVKRLAARQRKLALTVVALLVVPGGLLAPWLVRAFLPEYVAGIPALLVALLTPLVSCFGQGYGTVLHVFGKQSWYFGLFAVAILVNATASLTLVRPLGLVGVALAGLLAYGFLAVGRVIVGGYILRREARITSGSPR